MPKLRYFISTFFALLVLPIGSEGQELPWSLGGIDTVWTRYTELDSMLIRSGLQQASKMAYVYPDSAVAILGRLFRYSKSRNYTYGMARTLLSASQCFEYLGNMQQSQFFAAQAYPYCQREGLYRGLLTGHYYERLANIQSRLGNTNQAIQYYFDILRSLEPKSSGEWELLGSTYNNLGIVWQKQGQYNKALYYMDKGVEVARQDQLSRLVMHLYANMGAVYSLKDDMMQSRYYSQKANKLARRSGDIRMIQITTNNLGQAWLKAEPEKALTYFLEVLHYDVTDPYCSRMIPYNSIGEAYVSLGDYKEATHWLQLAVATGEKYGLRSDLKLAYQQLAKANKELGNYEDAYKFQELYSSLSDSMITAKQIETNQQLEVKYRTAEKDKEIANKALTLTRQQAKIREQQLWMLAGGGGFLLLSGLFFVGYRNIRHRRRLQEEKLNNLEQQQEIAALKSMMQGEEKERGRLARELHDGIVSQLAAAKLNFSDVQQRYPELSEAKDFEEAVNQLDDAALDLRNTAHNLMPDILLQQGFLPSLAHYCERMSKHAGFRIYFHLTGTLPELQQDAALSIYRIVQELIQNIIKHARASQAVVQINADETFFLLTVEDNGRGIKKDRLTDAALLKTVRTRVNVLNGTLDLRSDPGKGTTVSIELEMAQIRRRPALGANSMLNPSDKL